MFAADAGSVDHLLRFSNDSPMERRASEELQRSTIVIAIAFAPTSTPSSPEGDEAKPAKSGVWIPMPFGATAIIG